MEKERWINEVMQSTKGMKPAEPSPFLFEKISFRLEKKESRTGQEISFLRNWAVAVSLILVINLISLTYLLKDKPESRKESAYAALSKEMGLSDTSNY